MDSIACAIVHYFLVFLNTIGANSVIDFIAKQFPNSPQIDACLGSDSDFIQGCGDYTMLGYLLLLLIISMLFGRGFFFFWSSHD